MGTRDGNIGNIARAAETDLPGTGGVSQRTLTTGESSNILAERSAEGSEVFWALLNGALEGSEDQEEMGRALVNFDDIERYRDSNSNREQVDGEGRRLTGCRR
jgi:hypothetical protein